MSIHLLPKTFFTPTVNLHIIILYLNNYYIDKLIQ